MPTWALWILRFQVAAPMFFSGIAKLNADWLRGEPLRTWMQEEPDFPILGQFFFNEPIVWCFVYGAIMLDLCFSVYMLHHRTRIIGFCFVLFSISLTNVSSTLEYSPVSWSSPGSSFPPTC